MKKSVKTRAQSSSGNIRVTHPDRIMDASSGFTKMELAEYYVSVADWILPALQHRPVAFVRAPEGIAGELFFQKNVERMAIPSIETVEGESVILIDNAEGLVGAVQMSTIEFHSWNATAPDSIVWTGSSWISIRIRPCPALPSKSSCTLLINTLDAGRSRWIYLPCIPTRLTG
jgi:bifunctional non-homologous end joining protein LigD